MGIAHVYLVETNIVVESALVVLHKRFQYEESHRCRPVSMLLLAWHQFTAGAAKNLGFSSHEPALYRGGKIIT